MRRTLGNAFDPRRNSLNALRLILAALVIVSHAWPVGGFGRDPGLGDVTLGEGAVAGFFGISGYLITMSRMRSAGLADYFWRRVLRLYPAFLVVLAFTAFVAAPLSVTLSGRGAWDPLASMSYVVHNIGLRITQMGIPGTLEGMPMEGAWNGSLWTLWYEFLCYAAVGLVVSLLPLRRIGAFAVAAVAVCAGGVAVAAAADSTSTAVGNGLMLGGYFAAGCVLYCFRDRVPLSPLLAGAAGVAVALAAATSTFRMLGGIPSAYLMLWLGVTLPLHRLGARNDISYGMYVYAFPVQQLLVVAMGPRGVPVGVFILLSVVATVPFAVLSWFLVERPAMALKRVRWWRRTEPVPPPLPS